ncbi:MAG: hypothetical protein J6A15_04365 [Clostridia bacterium]|nr:hypothetical protein [Clostridia bacterium]
MNFNFENKNITADENAKSNFLKNLEAQVKNKSETYEHYKEIIKGKNT